MKPYRALAQTPGLVFEHFCCQLSLSLHLLEASPGPPICCWRRSWRRACDQHLPGDCRSGHGP